MCYEQCVGGTLPLGNAMFKRRWIWFGKLRSDEGFDLAYGHRTITYSDHRGAFEFPFEDEFLFPDPRQVQGVPMQLNATDAKQMTERVLDGSRFDGHHVEIWRK
jgi:hypothetical protein